MTDSRIHQHPEREENVEAMDLDSVLMDAFKDFVAESEKTDPRSSIPERPQLTAEATEAYVRDYEELESDMQYAQTLWTQIDEADRAKNNVIDEIKHLAFNARGPISHTALQTLIVRHDTAMNAYTRAKAVVRRYYAALEQNIRFFSIQTADIQAHRDSQHALLRPGEPAKVPVDTPTGGPRVTDEDALLRDYGIDLGM